MQPRLESIERNILHQTDAFREEIDYPPSSELAWMIGLIACGGSVNNRGTISFSSYDVDLLQKFRLRGEILFETNVFIASMRKRPDGTPYQIASMYNKKASIFLGNLGREQWPETINEQHPWILSRSEYTWKFLEGVFEARGLVNSKQQGVLFTSSYPNIVNYLGDLLTFVGVESPVMKYAGRGTEREKLMGVGIYNTQDLKLLADNIHSCVPRKEEVLDSYRRRENKRITSERTSDEELISEWKRIVEILGWPPKVRDIDKLHSESLTDFSSSVYSRKFGTIEGRQSFTIARKRLMELIGSSYNDIGKAEREHREAKEERQEKKKKIVIQEWRRLTEVLGHIPTATDIARLRREGRTSFAADTYAYNYGRLDDGSRSFAVARGRIQRQLYPDVHDDGMSRKELEGWTPVGSEKQLINEYIVAREICLRERGRLPRIRDIEDFRKRGIVLHTAHTLANYFGERSFIRARANLERLVAMDNADSSIEDTPLSDQGGDVFP